MWIRKERNFNSNDVQYFNLQQNFIVSWNTAKLFKLVKFLHVKVISQQIKQYFTYKITYITATYRQPNSFLEELFTYQFFYTYIFEEAMMVCSCTLIRPIQGLDYKPLPIVKNLKFYYIQCISKPKSSFSQWHLRFTLIIWSK